MTGVGAPLHMAEIRVQGRVWGTKLGVQLCGMWPHERLLTGLGQSVECGWGCADSGCPSRLVAAGAVILVS